MILTQSNQILTMNSQLIVLLGVVISVSGKVVPRQIREDFEVTDSHPWHTYGSYGQEAQEPKGNVPHMWRAKEYANAKVVGDLHGVIAASKARAVAESQVRALAYQAASQAKAAADQEAEESLWKAKVAAEDESKALSAAREAELAAKTANQSAINSQNDVKELYNSLLAAQERAEEEYHIAVEQSKCAEELKQKAASTTEARVHANYAAALATQKAKSAEEALWRVKHLFSH